MLDKFLRFLSFDLTPDQSKAVVQTAWRAGLAAFVAWSCGAFQIFGVPGFARADEISGVKAQMADLSAQFQKDQAQEAVASLEIQIKVLDQEIFEIEAKLAELGRLGQVADALYERRLVDLRSSKASAERKLTRAMTNPALDIPGPG